MRLPLRLVWTIVLLTAITWQLCSATVAAHEMSEAFAHVGEDVTEVHNLFDAELDDDSSDGQAEKGQQDHPAHAPCGPCHGHALGTAVEIDRASTSAPSSFVVPSQAGLFPSRPDGLFRPPRV